MATANKNRVKDWLFAISHTLPAGDEAGDEDTIVEGETPAEDLRSVYHALTWQKELGGAGITPGYGKWKHITAAFPLHNQTANGELLRKWSRSTGLTAKDLDIIRALFGEKVLVLSNSTSKGRRLTLCRSLSTSPSSTPTRCSSSSLPRGEFCAGCISGRIRSPVPLSIVSGASCLSSTGRSARWISVSAGE